MTKRASYRDGVDFLVALLWLEPVEDDEKGREKIKSRQAEVKRMFGMTEDSPPLRWDIKVFQADILRLYIFFYVAIEDMPLAHVSLPELYQTVEELLKDPEWRGKYLKG